MLNDVVVDTNVLVHAQNPKEQRFEDSTNLIDNILNSNTDLCVDEGFSEEEAKNKSAIGSEYFDKLCFGSVGFTLIVQLAHQNRIKQLGRRAPYKTSRRIIQILRNKADRNFLNVAYNSVEKVFVSHDFIDFQQPKKDRILSDFNIQVIEACDCLDCYCDL
jgi:predicted nucleic acid-binding protein